MDIDSPLDLKSYSHIPLMILASIFVYNIVSNLVPCGILQRLKIGKVLVHLRLWLAYIFLYSVFLWDVTLCSISSDC